MKKMKIAISTNADQCFETDRELVAVNNTNFTNVAAAVISIDDVEKGFLDVIKATGFELPIFLLISLDEKSSPELKAKIHPVLMQVSGVFERTAGRQKFYGDQLETAAQHYEQKILPPFFGTLKQYVSQAHDQLDCPGHQGGYFFRQHPSGRAFFEFLGENVFRSDICNADVALGDLLIHEGAALQAQKHAAQVFNADKTYFVLNGTSGSNKVVTSALLTPGDLVLFDRNNHKSVHQGALLQSGAVPVYLETSRNPFGFIGGIDDHCFEEDYLRQLIKEVAPEKADQKRPFRLAIIQLGTYDGTIYNARQVVDRIGHLCDYIFFDSAWVGYEQFIPIMKQCSPMLMKLDKDDPGIFVTQSVHKQQAGFSQASQIHKKDKHIKGQKRYVPHHRINNAFMAQASTSPFYPLFASLDVNAKIQEGAGGHKLWYDALKRGIEARKLALETCTMIRPFVPDRVGGRLWHDYSTEEIANDIRFFQFHPQDRWHGFKGYAENQYFVDPMKLMFTTPGIDPVSGAYTDFGIHAGILANFLRQNNIIPEKCDLNSILFLLTPAELGSKLSHLVSQFARFEQYIKSDALFEEVLPAIYGAHEKRYKNYSITRVCQEMHDLYKNLNVKELQKKMFRKEFFPKMAMLPQEANIEYFRGNVELVALDDAKGRIAAEGALPYPPGILCIIPGEVWDGPVWDYFIALQEGINLLPGFTPELQGVYLKEEDNGHTRAYGYVLKN